jgi:flagellar basal-body rod protein FlgB
MSGIGIQFGGGLFGSGSIPAIESVLRFTSQRQLVLLNNVANWNTPGFKAQDLPETDFRKALSAAVARRETSAQPLVFTGSRHIRRAPGGGFRMEPVAVETGAMRHDGNSVVIDQEQTKLLKNAMTAQVFNRMLAQKFRMLRSAISGRVP